jgi:hypothetical protein
MMRYLNGRPTDGDKVLAQTYITSMSLLLVTVFKTCLCGALAIAFTQHLWKIVRHQALRVSSIESLHGVRYNPFLLGQWQILHATPSLYMIAVVMWLLAVVILFPPSALTIVAQRFDSQRPTTVPIVNTDYGRDQGFLVLSAYGGGSSLGGISSLASWTRKPLESNTLPVSYL